MTASEAAASVLPTCDRDDCNEPATWLVGDYADGAYLCDEHGSPNRVRR